MTGASDTKVREHLLIAPQKSTHLALRRGEWIYIGARGNGGFTGKKVGSHLLGGPAAQLFTKQANSDIEDGKLRSDAPKAQLYNLKDDPRQMVNVIRHHPKVAEEMRSELERIKANPTASHSRTR
jgi:arylsulfatase A